MSGDYAELRDLLQERNQLLTRHEKTQLRAALDELERLREYVTALNEAQISLQSSSFMVGWYACHTAVMSASDAGGSATAALKYAEELRAVNIDAAPQQPERGSDADGAQ